MSEGRRVELLAPAGNPEGFYGAIAAGADAVYLGGSKFGARAYADNFTGEEIVECIRYAHLFGRKVYLTVNTLLKQAELEQDLLDFIAPLYAAGLDGVIIQDFGVLHLLKNAFPSLELHASTQMTITGKYGAELLKKMGCVRIVPSRELSLSEIIEIKNATGLTLETFVHGAMCYCYSGQCLFSSILGGRSGNRGRCAQPCRLPYRVKSQSKETKECYPLSLKDLCTIEHLPELIEAGIDSFKIEGRMKKAEYTAGVTALYRKYIDEYYNHPAASYCVDDRDLKELSGLYIRSERQNGYYYKRNGADMVALTNPAYMGSEEALLNRIRDAYLNRKFHYPIEIEAVFHIGKPACVRLLCNGLEVTATGEPVESAQKSPITMDNVEKQLRKLGDTCFKAQDVRIDLDANAFYPLKAINELRREVVRLMEDRLILQNGFSEVRSDANADALGDFPRYPKTSQNMIPADFERMESYGNYHISVRTLPQFRAVLEFTAKNSNFTEKIRRILICGDLFLQEREQIVEALRRAKALNNASLVIVQPYILRKNDEEYLRQLLQAAQMYPEVTGFLIRSVEGIGYLYEKRSFPVIYADCGFYLWNTEALQLWKDTIRGFCLPLELSGSSQRELLQKSKELRSSDGSVISPEKLIYGRIPMMVTANCLKKTTGKCEPLEHSEQVELIDRYHKHFPTVLNCRHCTNILYNSYPLTLYKELDRYRNLCNFRLDFTVEDAKETAQVLHFYASCECGQSIVRPAWEYTAGHEKRGVE